MDIRSLQKPLKEQYRNDSNASQITIRAKGGQTDVPVACSVDIGRAIYHAEAHKGAEAAVPAPVPVTFCLGLWRLARRSPVRWWLRLWAYQPNALRSRWRETWISEAPLVSPKTCPSALRTFIFILMSPRLRQPRNNCADCERKQSSIAL
jgi:hypothetical protein